MRFTRQGFRAVFRQPALFFAEITWRWAFGAAAWVLVFLSAHSFLSTITVSDAEAQLARTWQPFLVADVVVRILAANWAAALRAAVLLTLGTALLWVLAASLGRAITLQSLCGPALRPLRPGSLFTLHLFRALLSLAALIAWFGGLMLVGVFVPNPQENPGTVFLAGFAILFLVGLCWSVANWFLALAPIFIVRDARGAQASISDSFALYHARTAGYLSIASWFAFLRFIGVVLALLLSLIPLGMVGRASPAAITGTAIVIALVYFAFADFLYIARLAAFVSLAELPSIPVATPDLQPAPVPCNPETLKL